MSESLVKAQTVAPPPWLLAPLAVITAAGCVLFVALQQWILPLSLLQGVMALTGLAAGALLVFGPSRIVLTAVFLLALLDHSFRSMAIVPFAGVEWHPRDLLLLLLFAHAGVKLWRRRLWIHWTPLHVGMLLYTAFFAYAAWRGLWLGNAPRDIIAECRAPLFLGAFWVFAGAVREPRELQYYGNLALCVLVLLASATVVAFGWFALTGPIANTQSALGEFVPRVLGGGTVQSIRPGGHMWLEVGFVVALGMLLCPREPWYRKAVYLGLVPLFCAAIAAGMMRTALVSVVVSAAVMLWLNLPRVARGLALSLALGLAAVCVMLSVFLLPGDLGQALAGDRSLTARAVETQGALAAVREYPFFGAGFGASFEALGLAQRDSGGSAIPVDYHSLHNVWLYFLWKGGLVGLGLVVLALGGMLLYSQDVVNWLPSMSQRCLGRALQAALIGQIVASTAMPRLTYANGALFLGLWAMAFVLLARMADEAAARKPAPARLMLPVEEKPSPFVEPAGL